MLKIGNRTNMILSAFAVAALPLASCERSKDPKAEVAPNTPAQADNHYGSRPINEVMSSDEFLFKTVELLSGYYPPSFDVLPASVKTSQSATSSSQIDPKNRPELPIVNPPLPTSPWMPAKEEEISIPEKMENTEQANNSKPAKPRPYSSEQMFAAPNIMYSDQWNKRGVKMSDFKLGTACLPSRNSLSMSNKQVNAISPEQELEGIKKFMRMFGVDVK